MQVVKHRKMKGQSVQVLQNQLVNIAMLVLILGFIVLAISSVDQQLPAGSDAKNITSEGLLGLKQINNWWDVLIIVAIITVLIGGLVVVIRLVQARGFTGA